MKNLKVGSKTGLKYFGYKDIQGWEPCYDSIKYISKYKRVTAIDVLNAENVLFDDRLWVVLRPEIVSEKLMRLFAVWCCRETLKFIKNPDPRSIEAANVVEKFANGKATEEELAIASNAAWSAESVDPSLSIVWSAAAYAWSADDSAEIAAIYAAYSAAYSAAWSASEAAYSSEKSATWAAQKEKLIEMILAEATERKRSKKK